MYAVVWCDPHGGIGSVPKGNDGAPNPILDEEHALLAAQVIADLSWQMVVMLVEDEDLP